MTWSTHVSVRGREVAEAANRLTARWAGCVADGRSTVFSGAALWPLLGLLARGAAGPAQQQLAAAFGLDPAAAGSAARVSLGLLDCAPVVRAGFGLWFPAGLRAHEGWLGQVPPAALGRLSGDLGADRAALEVWAGRRTRGLVSSAPRGGGTAGALVLASAVSLETRWHGVPRARSTVAGSGPWSGRAVPRLARDADAHDVYLAHTPDGPVTVSRLRGRGEADVYLLLGEEHVPAGRVLGSGLGALRGRFPRTPSARWIGENPAPGVSVHWIDGDTGAAMAEVTCVAFDVRTDHDLLADADLFGLGALGADEPGGSLPGISRRALRLGAAGQSAAVRFAAGDFGAAQRTATQITRADTARGGQWSRLTAVAYTRPFGFAAVHRASGLILAAGWVGAPGAGASSGPTDPG